MGYNLEPFYILIRLVTVRRVGNFLIRIWIPTSYFDSDPNPNFNQVFWAIFGSTNKLKFKLQSSDSSPDPRKKCFYGSGSGKIIRILSTASNVISDTPKHLICDKRQKRQT